MLIKNHLLAIGLMIFSSASNAGLFGADSYDECILENMKNSNTDTAAKLIENSCRQKHANKGDQVTGAPCKIFWDGFKFIKGSNRTNAYKTFEFDNEYGVVFLEMTIPKMMAEKLQFKSQPDSSQGLMGKFYKENWQQIALLCSFSSN